MRFSALFVAAAAPFLTLAAPVKWTRSQSQALSQGNPNIAVIREYLHVIRTFVTPPSNFYPEFAEVLEQLETEFYTQALSKFVANDFTVAGISLPDIAIQNFQGIQSHEAAHVQVLVSSLTSPPY